MNEVVSRLMTVGCSIPALNLVHLVYEVITLIFTAIFSGKPRIDLSAFQTILESRSGIAMELPVSVVAISGKARTGKSFFSNLEIRFLKNVEEVLELYCYNYHIHMHTEFKQNLAQFTPLLASKELVMWCENTSVTSCTSSN